MLYVAYFLDLIASAGGTYIYKYVTYFLGFIASNEGTYTCKYTKMWSSSAVNICKYAILWILVMLCSKGALFHLWTLMTLYRGDHCSCHRCIMFKQEARY
jgi:hypothetical protein